MTYDPTPKQEQAIREWVQEAIVPLIEQVLVKKLGQAMSFAKQEVIVPPRKPLTDEEIERLEAMCIDPVDASGWGFLNRIRFARAIEAAHGIKGEA